jgi:hypothetical protein
MEPESIERIKLRCEEAAIKSEQWMLTHLRKEDLYTRGHKDPASYYKWPLTLLARRRKEEASRLFHWICNECLTSEGDFKSNRSGFHLEFHNYANLWLALAAIRLKEDQLTKKILGFVFNSYNKNTGGLLTNPLNVDFLTEDPLSACFFGMAINELENKEVADQILQYLKQLTEKQADPMKFWLRTKMNGSLITSVPVHADPKVYILELGREQESYYFLGAICLFLTGYLEKFGDKKAYSLAYQIAEILESIGSKALNTIWAAKVSPGCVGLYAATQDDLFLSLAEPVIDAVLGGQTSEGYWLKDDKPWITVSAEQCYWLTFMNNRL